MQGRRAIVTGAGGFIGSHLVEALINSGREVVALVEYSSEGGLGNLEGIPHVRDRLDIRLGDIRDSEFVSDLVEEGDVVFHLAALISIPYSYQAPRSYVDTNVVGTLNVLEAVRRTTNVRMIHTSTSEVYGTPTVLPITESNEINPQSPYAASKVAADAMCSSYATSYGVDVAILRPFNTYGPRQSMRAIIPTVLAQLLSGTEEIRLGSLKPRRDFTFVDDTVEGFVKLAEADFEPGEVIHLGTGRDISISELVEVCKSVTGRDARVVVDPTRLRPDASEVAQLLSDPSLAKRRLGWSPSVDLESGLRAFIDWFQTRSGSIAASEYKR